MGHAVTLLAISPSFTNWFVRRMEVMLWVVATSRPRSLGPGAHTVSAWTHMIWQPQLFFWWVISCLPLIPWCVCVCVCTSEMSCYFPSPHVTPKHTCRCLMYRREKGSLFPFNTKWIFNLLSAVYHINHQLNVLIVLRSNTSKKRVTPFDRLQYSQNRMERLPPYQSWSITFGNENNAYFNICFKLWSIRSTIISVKSLWNLFSVVLIPSLKDKWHIRLRGKASYLLLFCGFRWKAEKLAKC